MSTNAISARNTLAENWRLATQAGPASDDVVRQIRDIERNRLVMTAPSTSELKSTLGSIRDATERRRHALDVELESRRRFYAAMGESVAAACVGVHASGEACQSLRGIRAATANGAARLIAELEAHEQNLKQLTKLTRGLDLNP